MSQYQNSLYKLMFRQEIKFGSDDPNELVAYIGEKYPEGLPPFGGVGIEVGPRKKRLTGMQMQKWLVNPSARAFLERL